MSENLQQPQNEAAESEALSVKELLMLCMSRWYWFIISLVICMGLGFFYLLCTPPVYTRTAEVLIKTDSKGANSIGLDGRTSGFDLFQSKANINNEIATFRSPDLMLEVVKKLNLNMNYSVSGRFHRNVVYGTTLPINVMLTGEPRDSSVTFEVKLLADSMVMLEDFKRGTDKLGGTPIEGRLDNFIATPVGLVMVQHSHCFNPDSMEVEKPIRVTHVPMRKALEHYVKELTVSQEDEKSSVIVLSVKDVSTQRAVDILNTLIAVYNDRWIDDRNQIAVSTSHFIDERLGVIEKELGNVDSDISSYKSSNLLPDVQAVSSMYMQQATQANAEILRLNNMLYMAQYVKQYLIDPNTRFQLLPANSGFENAALTTQMAEYNNKLLERNNLVANSSESNPLVKDMDNALGEMRKAIVTSIDNQIETLRTNINAQKKYENRAISQIASNPQQAKYLLSVERQQKVKESLYLYLLQKREENELSQAFTAFNTRVLSMPQGSNIPTSPQNRKILLLAFVMGLLIPIGIIYLRENLNTKVRGRKDLESLKAPFIGEIPEASSGRKKGLIQKVIPKKVVDGENSVVVKEGSRNVINEAFRVVRANLEFMKGQSKVIAVVSANPGSGKTFITYNLALSFAIKDKKVITVDLDLRKGSQSKYVNSPKVGIADFLAGKVNDIESLIVKGDKRRPDVLPMGTMPPNPTELLYSPRFAEVINWLREHYELVFLDCPPVEIVADAAIINKEADMTIFIVRAGLFERGMLTEVNNFYNSGRYHNMAIMLNGTDARSGYGGSKYGYKYGYRYGYHQGNYGGYSSDK